METNLEHLLPYLPALVSHGVVLLTGLVVGYFLKSWQYRALPSQVDVVARTAMAAPLVVVYLASVVWAMNHEKYQTPNALHGIIAIVFAALFPKRLVNLNKIFGQLRPDKEEKDEP